MGAAPVTKQRAQVSARLSEGKLLLVEKIAPRASIPEASPVPPWSVPEADIGYNFLTTLKISQDKQVKNERREKDTNHYYKLCDFWTPSKDQFDAHKASLKHKKNRDPIFDLIGSYLLD